MRLVIDASPLLLRSAGVKNYLYYWLSHLQRAAVGETVDAFPFLGKLGDLTHERSTLKPWTTWPRLALLYAVNIPGNPLLDRIASRADVFHATNQLRMPIHSARVTATLFDMSAHLMPELHTRANVRADRAFLESVVRRAAGLIAISESTRQDAVRLVGVDPDRVEVIYPGVTEAFFEAGDAPRPNGPARPYVLCVGTIEPRKNIDRLLDAYAALPASLREEYDLVLAGPIGWASKATVARLRGGIPGVRYLGYVPEQQLPALTAGASVLAYPSLYEGFGFPVAQAMAAGVAVLTSAVSSLPEVAQDGALFVDPYSTSDIRAGLEKLLLSPSLRIRLALNGRRRAEQFRWENCARQSLDFFRKVAG